MILIWFQMSVTELGIGTAGHAPHDWLVGTNLNCCLSTQGVVAEHSEFIQNNDIDVSPSDHVFGDDAQTVMVDYEHINLGAI